MEEVSSLKRQRDEISQVTTIEEDVFKRQKSYKDIITLLEDQEEDYPNEDLSSLISTLQEEISSHSSSGPDPARNIYPEENGPGSGSEEEEREKVMRHLLEASDDELGLPSSNSEASTTTDIFSDEVVGGGHVDGGDFVFPLGGEGLWEFEDHEAANYYSLLQSSEIFI